MGKIIIATHPLGGKMSLEFKERIVTELTLYQKYV